MRGGGPEELGRELGVTGQSLRDWLKQADIDDGVREDGLASDFLRERPRPSTELAASVGVTPPAMSRHLRLLRSCGLVDESGVEHDARIRVYRLRPEPFASLDAWLDQVQAFWQHELTAFKAYAERPHGGGNPV